MRGPQVRTIVQVTTAAVFTFFVVFFLDRNFRVLPNALHEYLPSHHAGLVITDVTVTKCKSYNLFSSCALDPALAWHRVDKDLFLGQSLFSSAYLHVRRKREEELGPEDRVVVDVSVGRLNPAGKDTKGGGKAEEQERWEARPAGLWVKRSSKKGASDSKEAVTGVDVLFGDDATEARPGWRIVGTSLLLDGGSSIPATHVTIKRGGEQTVPKPVPRIGDNGRFKIMQLADLHLSTGVGVCRDYLPADWNGGRCEADPRTLDFVSKILEEERPNLVVLSGDQVNGETAPDTQSVSDYPAPRGGNQPLTTPGHLQVRAAPHQAQDPLRLHLWQPRRRRLHVARRADGPDRNPPLLALQGRPRRH